MIKWGAGLYWSQSAKGWFGLIATLPDDRLCVFRELVFSRLTPRKAAVQIIELCRLVGTEVPVVCAQPELFPAADGVGETIAETFRRNGVPMSAGDDDPINGPSRLRSWLDFEVNGLPAITFHAECKYLRKTLPTLTEDTKNPDEILDTPDAYPARGLMFYLMSRPAPAEKPETPTPQPGTWGYALRHVRQPASRVIGEYLR